MGACASSNPEDQRDAKDAPYGSSSKAHQPQTVQEVYARAEKLQLGHPAHYRIPTIKQDLDLKNKFRRCSIGEENRDVQSHTILLLGETGVGKSTFVDVLFNHVLNVNFGDGGRYHIVDTQLTPDNKGVAAVSHTEWVTSYTVHRLHGSQVGFSLSVIDTPGLQSSSAFRRDRDLENKIKWLLHNPMLVGAERIDAVYLLVDGTVPRLLENQRFVMQTIMEVLSEFWRRDVGVIFTHCNDDRTPPAVGALREAGVVFNDYFPFNNKALNAPGNDAVARICWNIGTRSLQRMMAAGGQQGLNISSSTLDRGTMERSTLNASGRGRGGGGGGASGGGGEGVDRRLADTVHRVDDVMAMTTLVQAGSPSHHLIPMVVDMFDTNRKCRKCRLGEVRDGRTWTVLLLGESGAGKSTLVDFIINYSLNVDFHDDRRYHIVDEDPAFENKSPEAKTDCVTCYTIARLDGSGVPFTLNIIDTPGLAHFNGFVHNRPVIDKIKLLLYNPRVVGVDHIDDVYMVVNSVTQHISSSEVYSTFRTVLEEFWGKDVRVVCTFCRDVGEPAVVKSLLDAGLPFMHYFTFNNLALNASSRNAFAEKFWGVGFKALGVMLGIETPRGVGSDAGSIQAPPVPRREPLYYLDPRGQINEPNDPRNQPQDLRSPPRDSWNDSRGPVVDPHRPPADPRDPRGLQQALSKSDPWGLSKEPRVSPTGMGPPGYYPPQQQQQQQQHQQQKQQQQYQQQNQTQKQTFSYSSSNQKSFQQTQNDPNYRSDTMFPFDQRPVGDSYRGYQLQDRRYPSDTTNPLPTPDRRYPVVAKAASVDSVLVAPSRRPPQQQELVARPAVWDSPSQQHSPFHEKMSVHSVEEALHYAVQVGGGVPAHYRIPLTEDVVDRANKIRICRLGEPPAHGTRQVTLLLLGQTGSGKTTLVDVLLNHVLGVSFSDNRRYHITDSLEASKTSESATQWMSCYTLHPLKGSRFDFTLHLIDTPGFGNTGGLARDDLLLRLIRQLIAEPQLVGVPCIDAVYLVISGSTVRLTDSEKHSLSIAKSVLPQSCDVICTFCDSKRTPPAIDALRAAHFPFSAYHIFNNMTLGAPSTNTLGELFWTIGVQSMSDMMAKLDARGPESFQSVRAQPAEAVVYARPHLQRQQQYEQQQYEQQQQRISGFTPDQEAMHWMNSAGTSNNAMANDQGQPPPRPNSAFTPTHAPVTHPVRQKSTYKGVKVLPDFPMTSTDRRSADFSGDRSSHNLVQQASTDVSTFQTIQQQPEHSNQNQDYRHHYGDSQIGSPESRNVRTEYGPNQSMVDYNLYQRGFPPNMDQGHGIMTSV